MTTPKALSDHAIRCLARAAKYQRGEYRLGQMLTIVSPQMWNILERAGMVGAKKVDREYSAYPVRLLTDAGYDFLEAQGL